MAGTNAFPLWARLALLLASVALAALIVALAGSKKYAKRVPNAVKVVLALVLSQAAGMYFLPLMRAMNVLPELLSGTAATVSGYAWEALGIIWAMPCAVTVCFALMPKNRAGTLFGLFSSLVTAAFTVLFLLKEYTAGHTLTVLFYMLSIVFGVVAVVMALSRRHAKKRE